MEGDKPGQRERSHLKMNFEKEVSGPQRGSMWFRSCSHPVIISQTCSPSLLVVAMPKEAGAWAEPSSPGLQVCTSTNLLKVWLCIEPLLSAAKEY